MPQILIVDDEEDLVNLTKYRLENAGYEILTACDGQAGLEKARNENPDLIVLDLAMPKMDGFAVCQALKSDDKYKNIPIIILTAHGKGLDLEKIVAKELGADAYITKPFDAQALVSKIQELLK